jgi:ATP-binding cassette subfamily F protein 3
MKTRTIWDEMLTVFDNLIEKNKKITKMQEQIADHPEDEDLLKRYDQLPTTLNKKAALPTKLKLRVFLTVLILKKILGIR